MKERIKELANKLEKEFIELSDEIYKNARLWQRLHICKRL